MSLYSNDVFHNELDEAVLNLIKQAWKCASSVLRIQSTHGLKHSYWLINEKLISTRLPCRVFMK